MTDRELIELAAKAAGIELRWHGGYLPFTAGHEWNPLTDDGDALRLAVQLDMALWIGCGGATAEFPLRGIACEEEADQHQGDKAAATRRAVVRAAAALAPKAAA